MQRIKIYENDNTYLTRGVSPAAIGYVLVPGFSSLKTTTEGAAQAFVPTECSTLAEFYMKFGEEPAEFIMNSNYYPCQGKYQVRNVLADQATRDATYLDSARLYKVASTYALDAQCIYNNSLWKAKQEISSASAEFDENQWEHLLKKDEYILVNKKYQQFSLEDITEGDVPNKKIKFTYVAEDKNIKGFPEIAIPQGSVADPTLVKMFEYDCDPSWSYAVELLKIGFPIIYVRMNEYTSEDGDDYDVSPKIAYERMHDKVFITDEYNLLLDKGLNIQFVTSGGYPTMEHNYVGIKEGGVDTKDDYTISQQMINIAQDIPLGKDEVRRVIGRGDCIALIDHTNNKYRPLIGKNSVRESVDMPENSFASVFSPWCKVSLSTISMVPASFIYLYTLGKLSTPNTPWAIISGVTRGRCDIIKELNTQSTLTNKIAEEYQSDFDDSTTVTKSINPITFIRNYGYCIWGDRTTKKYAKEETGYATSFLHVRNLVSDVKKEAYTVSQRYMFETNNDSLWTKFKLSMSTILDEMKAGNGLDNYYFTRYESSNASYLQAGITIYPGYGLEKVELSINLENNVETE